MKRLVSLFAVLALMLSLSLTACDGGGKTGKSAEKDKAFEELENGKVKLKFLMWGTPQEKDAVIKVLLKFKAQNPDIGIQVISVDSLNYSDKLNAMFAGGEYPDVFYLHKQDFYKYASKNQLLPLDSYSKEADFNLSDFYPKLVDAFTFGGTLYGIPKDWTSFVLYYNKDMFDAEKLAYPNENWTWDDFLKAAKALTKDINSDGQIDTYGIVIETWADWYNSWIKQNGGEIFDGSGNWVFGNPKYINANAESIQFIADLINKHKVAPDISTSKQLGKEDMFMNGKVAMCIYGRWVQLKFKSVNNFKWDYAALPKKTTRGSTVVCVAYSISKETKYPAESWKLLKFLTGFEGQVYTAQSGIGIPSRKSLVESTNYLKAPEVIKFQPQLAKDSADKDPLVTQLEIASMAPANPYWLEVRQKMDEQLEDVFLGNADAKNIILKLDGLVNDIISGKKAQVIEASEE